jgi:hypothetical protein
MDDKITISTYQFLKRFPNAEAARIYLEGRRWPQGAICPACGCVERIEPIRPGTTVTKNANVQRVVTHKMS